MANSCRPLLSGRLAKAWPSRLVESRRLPCHALVLVERGRGQLATLGGTWEITSRMLFVLREGVEHSYWARPRWTETWITFMADPGLLPTGTVYALDHRPEVAIALRRAVDALLPSPRPLTDAQRLATCALEYVLAELITGAGGPPETDPLVAAALALAGPNPTRWTPASLATALGLTYPTLRRRLRQSLGTSVQGWLIDLRLAKGRRALEDGATVTAAATAAGFTDPDSFSRSFAARIGLPPRDYQRSCC